MDSKQTKDIINNMSEEELNDFIFFALKEMTKKYENLVKKIQDKIVELKEENKTLEEKFGKQDGDYLYTKGGIDYLEELLKEESEV